MVTVKHLPRPAIEFTLLKNESVALAPQITTESVDTPNGTVKSVSSGTVNGNVPPSTVKSKSSKHNNANANFMLIIDFRTSVDLVCENLNLFIAKRSRSRM